MLLIVILLLILVAALVALVFALNALWSVIRNKVPYVPTPRWAVEWMAKHVGLSENAVVYDLGCGDARVLRALKKAHPSIRAIGYEIAWWPYLLARWRSRGTGVEIRHASYFHADLHDADLIFCFLLDAVMADTETLLRKQLKKGASVYSYGFRFPDWQASEEIRNPRPRGHSSLWVYRA